jgi:hypothetical protein
MLQEATGAGLYTPKLYPDRQYPRLQVLTIEELLGDKQVEYPRLAPAATFRRATRQRQSEGQAGRLL